MNGELEILLLPHHICFLIQSFGMRRYITYYNFNFRRFSFIATSSSHGPCTEIVQFCDSVCESLCYGGYTQGGFNSHSQWLCPSILEKWIIIWCKLFRIQSWVDMILPLIFVKLKTLRICGKYQELSIGPSLSTQLFFTLNTNRMLEFWVILLHIGLEHWLKHSSPSRHNSWWEPESTKLNDIYAQKNLIMKILITFH